MSESKYNIDSEILTLNKRAMERLRNNAYSEALSYLSEAEMMLKSNSCSDQISAITLNNLGCYFKKTGNLHEALSYLNQALDKERKASKDLINLAGTHLNLSAIYSQQKMHETALSHALKALKTVQNCPDRTTNMWTTQVIAHHSAGLEYESLCRLLEALHMYKKGWEIAKEHLGDSHALTLSLKKSMSRLSQVTYSSEAIPNGRPSRLMMRKPKTCSSRYVQRKAPMSVPPYEKPESFPNIYENLPLRENLSGMFYAEKKGKSRRNVRHSAEKYRDTLMVPRPPKRQVQSISKKKYETLKNIIDELEGNVMGRITPVECVGNTDPLGLRGKGKGKGGGLEDLRIAQADVWSAKNKEENRDKDTGTGTDNDKGRDRDRDKNKNNERGNSEKQIVMRKAKKNNLRNEENIAAKMQEAEIRAREAMKEVDKLKKAKEMLEVNEKKEIMPIPSRTKVEFSKRKQLHTIYESRYEDQLEPVILIQSRIKAWLQRTRFIKIKKAAEIIQKHVRMMNTKSLYKHIISAAVFIQAVYRGHRTRNMHKVLRNP